ncbi:MAG: DUF4303 domain-containing protein [Gammaproteobacteria bacterium]
MRAILMARPNFSELHNILVTSTRRALLDFSASEHNEEVYAVVFDMMEEYGNTILSLNTVSALEQRRAEVYPHYTDDQVKGLFGLKYNPGDFAFIDIGGEGEDQRVWAQSFELYLETLKSEAAIARNIERFSDTVVSVIRDLEGDLKQLDQTGDFVVFHCFHDVDNETIERLVRKTVDDDAFDSTFPEIRKGRELLAGVAELAVEKQAELWIGCLDTHAFGGSNAFAAEFFKNQMWLDIREKVIPLGAEALPSVLGLLDRVIDKPQFNEKGTPEYLEEGAFTRYLDVSLELLRILRKTGQVNDEIEQALVGYFRRLHEEAGDGDETIGLNLRWVAATLHSLMPGRYPEPDALFGNNKVRNFSAFTEPRRNDV